MPAFWKKDCAVHVYAKGPGPEEFPVTVDAPIITDGLTEEGVQPLLDLVKSLETHSNTEVAAAETERLDHWFSAASIYLTRALKDVDQSKIGHKKEKLKNLIEPGALKKAFNDMAAYTKVTMTSEVAILPSDINEGPAGHLFKHRYNPSYKYGEHPFSFGFLKTVERNDKNAALLSSTTIPTFSFDAGLMREIAPFQPLGLYRRFQMVVTDMNHDMLHHMHSLIINPAIAHKFDPSYLHHNSILDWSATLKGGMLSNLEEWSQISHGKIYMMPENAALVSDVSINLSRYFDELERIGKALPKDRAHVIVDYFGTAIAQTLSRTFPFTHPLMTQCLDRLQSADPLSEAELQKEACAKYCKMKNWEQTDLAIVRSSVNRFTKVKDIIEGYRQQGLDILPDDDNAVSFKGLKLLQLAALEPDEMGSHVPKPVDHKDQMARADSDRAFLDLISTMARTATKPPRSSQ